MCGGESPPGRGDSLVPILLLLEEMSYNGTSISLCACAPEPSQCTEAEVNVRARCGEPRSGREHPPAPTGGHGCQARAPRERLLVSDK